MASASGKESHLLLIHLPDAALSLRPVGNASRISVLLSFSAVCCTGLPLNGNTGARTLAALELDG
jgi:hypothetical protein